MAKINIEKMLTYLGISIDPELKKIISTLKRNAIDENLLAEKLKLRVNDVRKLLYKLSHKNYVTYTKEKSESKQWWYVYTWKLNSDKIIEDYLGRKIAELVSKKDSLSTEKEKEFRCSECSARFSYHGALENGFMCPACNGHLEQIKRKNVAAQLERDISQLKKDISAVAKPKKSKKPKKQKKT